MSSLGIYRKEENKPLIEKLPEKVLLITLESWNEVFRDKELQNLLVILRDGLKTLEEIVKEYNNTYEKRSKASIYRYIQIYLSNGLIIESGKIIKGKQHTAEKLYSSAAQIFFIDNQYLDAWQQGERSNLLALKIGIMVQHKFEQHGFDIHTLEEFFYTYEQQAIESAVHLLEKTHKEVKDDILLLNKDEKLVFFSILKNTFLYTSIDNLIKTKTNLLEIFLKTPIHVKELISQSLSKDDKYNRLIIEKPSGFTFDYIRKNFHFTNYENYIKYMLDINYRSILITLSTNSYPLSIKLLAEKFPFAYELALEYFVCTRNDTSNRIQSINEKQEKNLSENRIYQLIQDLKKDGLVIEAGRVINKDSSKTSILYTTTGKRIIYLENKDEYWKQEPSWKKIVFLLSKLFGYYLDKTVVDSNLFYTLFTKIEQFKFEAYKEIVNSVQDEEIINFYNHSLNFIELNASINALGLVNFLFNLNDILDTIKKLQLCFH